MLSIRCSGLPLALTCPASNAPAETFTDPKDNAGSAAGNAVHHMLSTGIPGFGYKIDAMRAASMFGATTDDVVRLSSWAWRQWDSLAHHFPEPQTEVYLEHEQDGLQMTGHADVLSVVGDQVRVLDFKTGRLDTNYDDQLRGYAFLSLKAYPEASTAYASILRVREQTVDGRLYGREELDYWFNRTRERLLEQSNYVPGLHCRHCPRSLNCAAKQDFLLETIAVIGEVRDTSRLDGLALRMTYDSMKFLESACERAREAIRLFLCDVGGQFSLGDGRELELVESKQRRLNPRLSLPILREYLPDDKLCECLTLVKGKIEAEISATAARGQKGKLISEVIDRLEVAGAIEITTTERLECRRSPEMIGVDR